LERASSHETRHADGQFDFICGIGRPRRQRARIGSCGARKQPALLIFARRTALLVEPRNSAASDRGSLTANAAGVGRLTVQPQSLARKARQIGPTFAATSCGYTYSSFAAIDSIKDTSWRWTV